MYKYKSIYHIFYLFFLLGLSSCNCFFNLTRQKTVEPKIKKFIPNKKDTLVINSLSIITRFSLNENNDWKIFDRAKILDFEIYFEDIKKDILRLNESTDFKIKFENEVVVNDRVYNNLVSNNDFIKGFTYTQLSKIDFSDKKDGLYIIVTVIKEDNGQVVSSKEHNYDCNLVYDFCLIKNGLLQEHSVFLRHRRLNFWNLPKLRWKPLPRDTRRVFRKLYKQKK
jgi:hypothetical protein